MKTETMCVEALWSVFTHQNFVFLFAAPFENQIRLIFTRLQELINGSPLLKTKVVGSTKNPYEIRLDNNSRIVGFTSSASSGNGGASIRGQRADYVALDEMDYLAENDFDNISMLAAERPDIRMVCSSTPTGKRGSFYKICTDKSTGYKEHYHPSTHNPNWNEEMEVEFRSELSDIAFDHEVLAIFGEEQSGVFNKTDVDYACRIENYAYNELTTNQLTMIERNDMDLPMMYLPIGNKFKPNIFRTMGVDWDKYGASSSILILDYDINIDKYRIIRRIEVPKAEYSYDAAVNLIIELNEIYNPSWIYVDRGAGEYQIEKLHIEGERLKNGLNNKVKGWSFANKIEVPDPIKRTTTSEHLKPFMVNQLCILFERHKIVMSPYDTVLPKQLIDYRVERITQSGIPVYNSDNEHFVDALGLAYLAFVLEFPKLAKGIKEIENTTIMKHINAGFQEQRAQIDLFSIANFAQKNNPWVKNEADETELRGDKQTYYKIPNGTPLGFYKGGSSGGSIGWGSRGSFMRNSNRASW